MPKGQALEIVALGTFTATEIKKESETTTTNILTPGAGKVWRITNLVLEASAETAATIEDETTAVSVIPLPAKAAVVVDLATLSKSGLVSTKAANKLKIKLTNTAKLTGTIYGIEDVS